MISDRDRRILADIERQTRAQDPELCDRLGGPGAGAGGRLLDRASSTTAIVCWILALAAALVLGLSLVSLLLVVAVVVSATVRVWRTPGDIGSVQGGRPPYGLPPFGLPPFGPR
ncbi:DUF3040 domain-containing protein [Pseudonocardia saturnea]